MNLVGAIRVKIILTHSLVDICLLSLLKIDEHAQTTKHD